MSKKRSKHELLLDAVGTLLKNMEKYRTTGGMDCLARWDDVVRMESAYSRVVREGERPLAQR